MEPIRDFGQAVSQMPGIFDELSRCPLCALHPRAGFPKQRGVYALYAGGDPIYVGRAKNLHQRIGNHIGGRPEQSSFAFKLARDTLGLKATYKPIGSRKDLMLNKDFLAAFQTRVAEIRQLQGRFVVIKDDVLQHLFEVYTALALRTRHNQFGTS